MHIQSCLEGLQRPQMNLAQLAKAYAPGIVRRMQPAQASPLWTCMLVDMPECAVGHMRNAYHCLLIACLPIFNATRKSPVDFQYTNCSQYANCYATDKASRGKALAKLRVMIFIQALSIDAHESKMASPARQLKI